MKDIKDIKNFDDFLALLKTHLERSKKPRQPARVKTGKHNKGKLSSEEILKYRQLLNDKSYLKKAVEKTAEILIKMEGL